MPNEYEERDALVMKLFKCSYPEYLKTKLWGSTRKAALSRDCGKCRVCGVPATEVHHRQYDEDTLRGAIEHLLSLCRGCHERLEMVKAGRKRSFAEVEWELVLMLAEAEQIRRGNGVRSRPLTPGERVMQERTQRTVHAMARRDIRERRRSRIPNKKRNGRRRVK